MAIGTALAIGGGLAALGAISGVAGSAMQSNAARDVAELQRKMASEARAYQEGMANKANYVYNKYTPFAQDAVTQGQVDAMGRLGSGLMDAQAYQRQGIGQLGDMYGQSFGTLDAAQQQALQSYYGGQQGFNAAMQQGMGQGIGALNQGMGGVSNLQGLIGSGNMYSGFQQDPGYQFRQQQGEQAINRAASAAGGRVSGRTLQELGNFNQGLASQEFQNFANRRGQEIGALQSLAGMQQQGGANMANMLYGGNAAMAGQSAATAGDMARMQAAMGSQVAGAQQGLGGQLAGIYGNMGSQALGVAGQQAGLETGLGSQLAELYMQQAQGRANAYMGAASNSAGISNNAINQMGNQVPYAGQAWGAAGDALANMGQNAMFYSMMGGGGGGYTPAYQPPAGQSLTVPYPAVG